ncbi:Kielin/chordin-like protein [Dissostichus eleginoides]|uniref:Kielin/chordin-like protein n=1 Tax=Dissostichus eleginoides TaxID=100907 RepID=A0AAD9CBE6_DISEL|nr:Kielin/chordin-like protein [Dissostichus eleginoides]
MLRLLLFLAALSQLTALFSVSAHGNPRLCTVSGPSVIDFNGDIAFVRDRCAYTLLSKSGLEVMAIFKERRREDVSFLDQVILRYNGVDFNLGQGGIVQQDGTTLTLSSTQKTVQGVKLSKDVDGVTAKVPIGNNVTTIVFDGTTAQILLTGAEKSVSEFSPSSCETLVSEPADSHINCTIMTDRCNLLKKAPFTSCHSLIDPAPYITACIDMLCKYPALDGLNCQFLQAYAEACSVQNDHTATDQKITYKNVIKIDDNVPSTQRCSKIQSGSWNYTLSMTMCTDITCTEEFDFSGGVQMDQTIYMSMDARYDLIIDGCRNPEDDTVKTVFNKNGGTIIAFQMFQFKGSSNSGLDLGFRMKLCLTSDKKCMPVKKLNTDTLA